MSNSVGKVMSELTIPLCILYILQNQATPLFIAATNGYAGAVDMLLAYGANVNHMAAVSKLITHQ